MIPVIVTIPVATGIAAVDRLENLERFVATAGVDQTFRLLNGRPDIGQVRQPAGGPIAEIGVGPGGHGSAQSGSRTIFGSGSPTWSMQMYISSSGTTWTVRVFYTP